VWIPFLSIGLIGSSRQTGDSRWHHMRPLLNPQLFLFPDCCVAEWRGRIRRDHQLGCTPDGSAGQTALYDCKKCSGE
jgi:hypothetical protein